MFGEWMTPVSISPGDLTKMDFQKNPIERTEHFRTSHYKIPGRIKEAPPARR
jgi:hypothetical protein